MDSPDAWRWIWLAVTVAFVVAEIALAGSFFMLPFGIGAAAAAVLAFIGVGLIGEWLAFVAVSVVCFAVLRPLGRRLELRHSAEAVGARRWIGQRATVVRAIPAGASSTGLIRIHGEEWRAESMFGHPIPVGSTVKVVRIDGTRAVVLLLEEPADAEPGPTG